MLEEDAAHLIDLIVDAISVVVCAGLPLGLPGLDDELLDEALARTAREAPFRLEDFLERARRVVIVARVARGCTPGPHRRGKVEPGSLAHLDRLPRGGLRGHAFRRLQERGRIADKEAIATHFLDARVEAVVQPYGRRIVREAGHERRH